MKRPNLETNARLGLADQESSLPAWIPFAVLLFASAALLAKWDQIPDRWVTHWDYSGQPNGWTSKSPMGVFLPIGLGIVTCTFLEILARTIEKKKTAEGFDLSPEVVSLMAAATANLMRFTNLAMSMFIAVLAVALPLYQPRSPAFVVGAAIALVGTAVAFGLRRYNRVHRMLKERRLLDGAEGWNGFSYNNPADPRLWLPKPFGHGYTINFGHRWAWPLFLLILSIPLIVVLVIAVLAR